MVSSTQRNGELVADPAAEGAALGKAQVVGVRGSPAANQARALGERPDMLPVSNPARLRQGQQALVDRPRLRRGALPPGLRRGRASRPSRSRLLDLEGVRGTRWKGVASLAWKSSSTRSASALVSTFFSARHRCAQMAISSPQPKLPSSARSRSRSSADASGPSIGFVGLASPRRRGEPT